MKRSRQGIPQISLSTSDKTDEHNDKVENGDSEYENMAPVITIMIMVMIIVAIVI